MKANAAGFHYHLTNFWRSRDHKLRLEYKKDDFDFSTLSISEWLAKNCSFASYAADRRTNHGTELGNIVLARPQVEGVGRAIARNNWNTCQNQPEQTLAAEGYEVLVLQSAHDAAFVHTLSERLDIKHGHVWVVTANFAPRLYSTVARDPPALSVVRSRVEVGSDGALCYTI